MEAKLSVIKSWGVVRRNMSSQDVKPNLFIRELYMLQYRQSEKHTNVIRKPTHEDLDEAFLVVVYSAKKPQNPSKRSNSEFKEFQS